MQRPVTLEDLKDRVAVLGVKLGSFYGQLKLLDALAPEEKLEVDKLHIETIDVEFIRTDDYQLLKTYFDKLHRSFLGLDNVLKSSQAKKELSNRKESETYLEIAQSFIKLAPEIIQYGITLNNEQLQENAHRQAKKPPTDLIVYSASIITELLHALEKPKDELERADKDLLDGWDSTILTFNEAVELQDDEIEAYSKDKNATNDRQKNKELSSLQNMVIDIDSNLKSTKALRAWNEKRNDLAENLQIPLHQLNVNAKIIAYVNNLIKEVQELIISLESEIQKEIKATLNKGKKLDDNKTLEKAASKQENLKQKLFPFLESLLIKMHENEPISWHETKEKFLQLRQETKEKTPQVLGGFFKHRTKDLYDEVQSFIDEQVQLQQTNRSTPNKK